MDDNVDENELVANDLEGPPLGIAESAAQGQLVGVSKKNDTHEYYHFLLCCNRMAPKYFKSQDSFVKKL
jgi:hypothetical protein